jgi:hypothetical protein
MKAGTLNLVETSGPDQALPLLFFLRTNIRNYTASQNVTFNDYYELPEF